MFITLKPAQCRAQHRPNRKCIHVLHSVILGNRTLAYAIMVESITAAHGLTDSGFRLQDGIGSSSDNRTTRQSVRKFSAILHFSGTEGNFIDIYINN